MDMLQEWNEQPHSVHAWQQHDALHMDTAAADEASDLLSPSALLSPTTSSSSLSGAYDFGELASGQCGHADESALLSVNMFDPRMLSECFASADLPSCDIDMDPYPFSPPGSCSPHHSLSPHDMFSPPSSSATSPLGECDSDHTGGSTSPIRVLRHTESPSPPRVYSLGEGDGASSASSSCASSPPSVRASKSKGSAGEKPKKKRRRRRKADEPPHVPTALTIEREKLLKMSLSAFDHFVRTVSEARKLSLEELRDVKRQRRLIKNRESAYASRVRRKSQVQEMEQKIAALEEEREELSGRVADLEAENSHLSGMLASLSHHAHSAVSSVWDAVTVAAPAAPPSASASGAPSRAAAKVGGACLLIVLLSFGLFVNFGSAPGPASAPAPAMRYMYEPSAGNAVADRPRSLAQPGAMRLLAMEPTAGNVGWGGGGEHAAAAVPSSASASATAEEWRGGAEVAWKRKGAAEGLVELSDESEEVDGGASAGARARRNHNATHVHCRTLSSATALASHEMRAVDEGRQSILEVHPHSALSHAAAAAAAPSAPAAAQSQLLLCDVVGHAAHSASSPLAASAGRPLASQSLGALSRAAASFAFSSSSSHVAASA